MLRIIKIIILICCACFQCNAQSYRNYWQNIMKARVYMYDDSIPHNEDSALYYIHRAYCVLKDKSIMAVCQPFTYHFLIEKHAERKEYDMVRLYLKELSFWEPKDSTFQFVTRKCTSCDSLSKKFNSFYPSRQNRLLLKTKDLKEYDSIISITLYRDQFVRTTPGISRDTFVYINDINFYNYQYCLKKYGYVLSNTPIDSMGPVNSFLPLFMIHIDNWSRFQSVNKIFMKAIKSCKLEPNNYIYAYDRSRVKGGLRPLYFAFLKGQDQYEKFKPTPIELKRANRLRAKLGLPAYDEPMD